MEESDKINAEKTVRQPAVFFACAKKNRISGGKAVIQKGEWKYGNEAEKSIYDRRTCDRDCRYRDFGGGTDPDVHVSDPEGERIERYANLA